MGGIDLDILIMGVAVATLISLTAIGYVALAPRMAARARMRQRMAMATGGASERRTGAVGKDDSALRRREIQQKLKQFEDNKTKESRLSQYRKDLKQAGLNLSLRKFFIVCGVVGVIAGIVYVVMGYPLIGVVPVAITVGFGLPRFVVGYLSKRRVKMFTSNFANAVDVIVRGIKSGLPVGECLNIIARESPEPVAGVFNEIVEAQRLGVNLDEALIRSQDSMPTSELKFFSIVLSIQQQTGGNLAETLANLSDILRSRKKMEDKVKAMSSEAKASSMIIGSLPFLMTGLLWLVSPEYIGLLFSEDVGKIMVACGIGWMSIGVFVMKQMVNFEI